MWCVENFLQVEGGDALLLVTALLGGGEEVGHCLLLGQVLINLLLRDFSALVLRAHAALIFAGLVDADVELGLEDLPENPESEWSRDGSAIHPV